MYKFKKELKSKIKNGLTDADMAEKIGISREYLSYILNNRYNCRKTVAYCIVKIANSDYEIEDFFDKIEE